VEGLAALVLILVIVASTAAGVSQWRVAGRQEPRVARGRGAAGVRSGIAARGYAIASFAWAGAMLVALVIVLLAPG